MHRHVLPLNPTCARPARVASHLSAEALWAALSVLCRPRMLATSLDDAALPVDCGRLGPGVGEPVGCFVGCFVWAGAEVGAWEGVGKPVGCFVGCFVWIGVAVGVGDVVGMSVG